MAGQKQRRMLWLSGVLAVCLMAFGVIAFKLVLPRLVERYIIGGLRSAGIERADLDVRRIGWNQALLTDLRVGADNELRIAELIARYSLHDLFQGRLERIAVSGLRMAIRVDTDGVSFGALDRLAKSTRDGEAAPPVLPVAAIEIRASRLDVTTPFGAGAVLVSARLHPASSGRLQVTAEAGVLSPNASLSATGAMRLEPDGGLQGSLRISRGSLTFPGFNAGAISGEIAFRGLGSEIERLEGKFSSGELDLPLASFRKTGLEFDLAGNLLTAKGTTVSAEGHTEVEFAARVDDIFASAPSLTLRGEVEARKAPALHSALAPPRTVEGRGRVALALSGTLPEIGQWSALRGGWEKLDAFALNGTVELDLSGASLPGPITGLSAAGRLEVGLSGRLLTVGSAEGIQIEAEGPGRAFFEGWPGAAGFHRNLEGPLSLRIGGGTRTPLVLQARATEGSIALRASGGTLLTVEKGPRLESEINASAEIFSDWRLKRFDISRLTIALADWRQATGTAAVTVRDVRLGGTLENFSGRLSAEISAAAARFSNLAIEEPRLALGGGLVFRDRRMVVSLGKDVLARVAAVRWEGPVATLGPLSLLVDPDDGSRLEVDFGQAGGPVLRYRVALVPSPVRADILSPDQRMPVLARDLRVRLEGAYVLGQGDHRARVAATGGSLEMPTQAVALRGVEIELSLDPSLRPEGLSASLNVSRILQLESPAYIKPLQLKAGLRSRGGRLLFSGQIGEATGALALGFEGSHDLAHGGGGVHFALHPLRFTPDVTPQDLFPALRDWVASASGKLGLRGQITWAAGTFAPTLDLSMEGVSLRTDRLAMDGLDSVVRLNGLRPLSTPPGQLVSIALIDVGLPFADGVTSFHIAPAGALVIERTEWGLAGGKIRAQGISIDPTSPRHEFVVEIQGVDLRQLAALAKVEGLTVTGTLNGDLPVLIEGGSLTIRKGSFEAGREGGVVRYRPSEVPSALRHGGEKTRLLLSALENFRYEALRVRLDGRSDGDAEVSLHLRGANPQFFKGHPVELNLSLTGQLERMLQGGLKGLRIPDTIIQQFQKSGR